MTIKCIPVIVWKLQSHYPFLYQYHANWPLGIEMYHHHGRTAWETGNFPKIRQFRKKNRFLTLQSPVVKWTFISISTSKDDGSKHFKQVDEYTDTEMILVALICNFYVPSFTTQTQFSEKKIKIKKNAETFLQWLKMMFCVLVSSEEVWITNAWVGLATPDFE